MDLWIDADNSKLIIQNSCRWAVKDSNLRRAKPDWFTASSDWPLRQLPMEPTVRFELTASCLQNSCSATELRRRTEPTVCVRFFRYRTLLYAFFIHGFPRDADHYTAFEMSMSRKIRAPTCACC